MQTEATTVGLALWCDIEGVVKQIIRDDLGLTLHQNIIERPLTLIVEPQSMGKALSFLVELRTRQAVFNWELNILLAQEINTLHFGGIAIDSNLLILAARTNAEVMHLHEELMQISNEQVNALRAAVKEQIRLSQTQTERDSELYNEISRLNNELVNLQRELTKKNIQLEQLNAQKNQFLGMASHDLRSPLAIIISYSEFILAEAATVLDPQHLEFLSIIHSSSNFMLGMINDLLDVATIESGQLKLNLEPVDLIDLISRNVTLNRVLADGKDIDIQFHPGQPHLFLLLDKYKIEQVLNNLISNAIKFSYPHTAIKVRADKNNTDMIISVQDEGQGIPAHELDNLFKPFARTSVKSTAGEKSTGLGLMIARKVIEGHHGKIWVESTVGQGSTFFFTLPLQDEPHDVKEAKK